MLSAPQCLSVTLRILQRLSVEDLSAAPLSLIWCSSEGSDGACDDVDLESEFLDRACVMKSPPIFLRGMYRCAMRFVLTEADRCREVGDQVGLTRAWKKVHAVAWTIAA